MALDVHIVGPVYYWPVKGSYTSFGFEDEHEEIILLAEAHLGSGSQVAKMREYYNDTLYASDDLLHLITELDQLIAAHQEADNLQVTLEKYREICVQAARENKGIYLLSD